MWMEIRGQRVSWRKLLIRGIYRLTLAVTLSFLITSLGRATTHKFYQGKIVRIVVGFSAGGGFDVVSRAIGRHISKYIPGNPTVIVENMPGAGSLISANHMYRVAKPDGLTIGHFNGSLFMQKLLGRPGIEFDPLKFAYIGVPVRITSVCAFTKVSGIISMEKWLASKTAVKLGGLAPGSNTDDFPLILAATIGLPIQLVSGYKGTPEMRQAAEGGEVAGFCVGWSVVKTMWSRAIESGDVAVVLQMAPRPLSELPGVPLAIHFAKTEEALQLIQVGVHDMGDIIRPYVLPPGTPKERARILRKAFMSALKDPGFVAEAEKSRLDIDPLTGEEVERTVDRLMKLQPSLITKLKAILR